MARLTPQVPLRVTKFVPFMHSYAFPRVHRWQQRVRQVFAIDRFNWRSATGLMVGACAVPFLVHGMPWDGAKPLGVHLLPAFWTAFVAVYLYGFGAAALVALVVPLVTAWATAHPVADQVVPLTLHLLAFVALSAWLVRRWPTLRLNALWAWLILQPLAIVAGQLWQSGDVQAVAAPFGDALITSASGLAILGAVNVALVRLLPKDRDWDAE